MSKYKEVEVANPYETLRTLLAKEEFNSDPFSIVSKKTGAKYTFKLRRTKFNDNYYLHVFIDTNYMVWARIGNYFKGFLYNQGVRSEKQSSRSIAYVLNKVEKGDESINEQIKLYHVGSCLLCGRALTTEESILTGIGPTCAKRVKVK